MKKQPALALSLAGIALAASACSPGNTVSPGPGTAVQTPTTTSAPATPAPATGWELSPKGGGDRIKAAGLAVLTAEGAAEHFHAHLDVFVDGKPVTVPADIGFELDTTGHPTGISALHTHDESGIIHIEAPALGATYTLGQFLTEWGVLNGTDTTPGSPHAGSDGWTVTINGTKHAGTVSDVVLNAHDEIVLSYGAAPAQAPIAFKFPQGL